MCQYIDVEAAAAAAAKPGCQAAAQQLLQDGAITRVLQVRWIATGLLLPAALLQPRPQGEGELSRGRDSFFT